MSESAGSSSITFAGFRFKSLDLLDGVSQPYCDPFRSFRTRGGLGLSGNDRDDLARSKSPVHARRKSSADGNLPGDSPQPQEKRKIYHSDGTTHGG